MIKRILSFLMLSGIVLVSCKKETRDLKQVEEEQINAYMKKNDLTGFIKDTSGYYYQIVNPGTTGDLLKYSSYVSLSQKTTSINKDVDYEFSIYNPQSNYVGYITPISWRETLIKVKKGAQVRIITPSYLAFGKDGSGSSIPGNAILDTKITVVDDSDRPAYEDGLIQNFLTENKITAVKDTSGIYYQIITPGTGTAITSTSATLKVAYTGRLLTGTIFDRTTSSSPLTIGLNNVIVGWQRGVPKIKAGGKIRLFIPSRLAYGSSSSNVPANSILDFDIDLIDVTN